MSKDPAFLFYSKDWLEGTAELTSEEKGVYIDLLAHQHQKGSLPPEIKKLAKLSGISEPHFIEIWKELENKFIPNDSGRLVNRKLNGIVTERLDRGWRNTILGTLASVVRLSGQPYEIIQEAKKTFKVDDFLGTDKQNLTAAITEWFGKRLKSIANEDGNANANIKDSLGGAGEKKGTLTFEMVKMFKDANPNYPVDVKSDYSSCLEIAYKIADLKKWDKQSVMNGKMPNIIDAWGSIIVFVKADEWFSGRSISDLKKEFQRLMQKMSKNGTHQQSVNGNSKSASAYELLEKARKIATGGE